MLPNLYTCLSPALLNSYPVSDSIVVIIDVLRATSTIATALFNDAESVVPVTSVEECIAAGSKDNCITAGERDGKVADGLTYGNTPFQYTKSFVAGKTLVLTTTNGTKLLHQALNNKAGSIITGSFANLSAVCNYIVVEKRPVILACAAWKDKVNIEDTLFAGAVISRVKDHFKIDCDSSKIAETLYTVARGDMFAFMKENDASHYHRLMNYGLEKDIRYCLGTDLANVLVIFKEGKLVSA